MPHQFKPGEWVLLVAPHPLSGELTTVVAGPIVNECHDYGDPDAVPLGAICYQVDLEDIEPWLYVHAEPHELLPLLDDSKTAEYLAELSSPSDAVNSDKEKV